MCSVESRGRNATLDSVTELAVYVCKNDVGEKKIAFLTTIGPHFQRQLFDAAMLVSGKARELLGPALLCLSRHTREHYAALNTPPTPTPEDVAAVKQELDDPQRGVVRYLAGWAVRQELSYAYRHAACLLDRSVKSVRTEHPQKEGELISRTEPRGHRTNHTPSPPSAGGSTRGAPPTTQTPLERPLVVFVLPAVAAGRGR